MHFKWLCRKSDDLTSHSVATLQPTIFQEKMNLKFDISDDQNEVGHHPVEIKMFLKLVSTKFWIFMMCSRSKASFFSVFKFCQLRPAHTFTLTGYWVCVSWYQCGLIPVKYLQLWWLTLQFNKNVTSLLKTMLFNKLRSAKVLFIIILHD